MSATPVAPRPRFPIVCVYAVRSEPDWLVRDMRANLPWVTDFLELDNRAATGGWQHEGELRRRQIRMVRDWLKGRPGATGAWVLQLDPDERLEDRAADIIPAILAGLERGEHSGALHRVTLSFPLREMWTPAAYRVDGEWAKKKPRVRLFWYSPTALQAFRFHRPIHVGLMPRLAAGESIRVRTEINLYHLKSIEPMNRVRRAAAYLDADPNFDHQRREGRDWTWLYDESGLQLEAIPDGRGFSPPYLAGSYDFIAPH